MPALDHSESIPCGAPGCKTCSIAAQYRLTLTDLAVIVLIANKYSNGDIAAKASLKPAVLRDRIASLNKRLGTTSKLDIAMWAVRTGLVKVAVEGSNESRSNTSNTGIYSQ